MNTDVSGTGLPIAQRAADHVFKAVIASYASSDDAHKLGILK